MEHVVALGMFDGVHGGHRVLLTRAAEIAKKIGGISHVFTFSNPPKSLFGGVEPLLCSKRLRERRIKNCGIDSVDTVPFDRSLAEYSPEAFVEMLLERYRPLHTVVIGYDYRFGKGAAGDAERLKLLSERYGFHVLVVSPVLFEGEPYASTRIRTALDEGNVEKAAAMLGCPVILEGKVEHGRGVGRTLGTPTANLCTDGQYLPKNGVYASALLHRGEVLCGATNIGVRPTYHGNVRTVETFLPDIRRELYGETVALVLLRRMRNEQKFADATELSEAIMRDSEAAKKVFEECKKSVYNAKELC